MRNIVRVLGLLAFAAGTTCLYAGDAIVVEFVAGPVQGHVHASTLLPLSDGGYLAAWFEGTKEGARDVAIKGATRRKGTWSPVRVLAKANPEAPHWNPVLRRGEDGRIVLYYKVGRNCSDWRTYFQESRDEGESWTPACELVVGDVWGGRGPVKNKCLRLKSGRVLAPASREFNPLKPSRLESEWRAFVDISDDDGRTWRKSPEFPMPVKAHPKAGVIQPSLWEDEAGVHALMRATDGWIWRSDSQDRGETWTTAYPTALQNINSGLDCVRASDGRIYLVRNGLPSGQVKGWGARNHLELMASADGGATWRALRTLAHDAAKQPDGRPTEFSYPSIQEARPGVLSITYTYNRRQIRFLELPLAQAEDSAL